MQEAIEACYSLLSTVQRLWRKVSTEDDDDYIAQPKPSGYQSLHTAVIGVLSLELRAAWVAYPTPSCVHMVLGFWV